MRRSRFIRCFYKLPETESICVNYPQWHEIPRKLIGLDRILTDKALWRQIASLSPLSFGLFLSLFSSAHVKYVIFPRVMFSKEPRNNRFVTDSFKWLLAIYLKFASMSMCDTEFKFSSLLSSYVHNSYCEERDCKCISVSWHAALVIQSRLCTWDKTRNLR